MSKDFFKNLSKDLQKSHLVKKPYTSRLLREVCVSKKSAVTKESNEWEILESPRRLSKIYSFNKSTHVKEFISEMIDYHSRYKHEGDIQINQNKVLVEVHTKDLNNLTELDYEYSRMADLIYKDIGHYNDEL